MPDMRGAMQKSGLKGSDPPTRGGHSANQQKNPFPAGYPKYFDTDGKPRIEIVLSEAQDVADAFANDKLRRSQLRAFYGHAKSQLQRLQHGADFREVHFEVARLKVFASDRAARSENQLPKSFKDFIDRNVDAVRDQKSFEKGFMPHFEAVVGYCARIKD